MDKRCSLCGSEFKSGKEFQEVWRKYLLNPEFGIKKEALAFHVAYGRVGEIGRPFRFLCMPIYGDLSTKNIEVTPLYLTKAEYRHFSLAGKRNREKKKE